MSFPPTDLEQVVKAEIKEWHFHIYFHQNNAEEHYAALKLRDAVLRLRRDGAFVAVPFVTVNTSPEGPHPVGSYEIWVPSTSFASVFSYLCQHRGNLSILVHPLTCEVVSSVPLSSCATNATIEHGFAREGRLSDHELRSAWIGPSHPLDLSKLSVLLENVPLQYPSLELGYSAPEPDLTLEDRRRNGGNVEKILRGEKEAAHAPTN